MLIYAFIFGVVFEAREQYFPAFILVDDKGNDFFKQIKPRCAK
jgi:fumarate hydratase class I